MTVAWEFNDLIAIDDVVSLRRVSRRTVHNWMENGLPYRQIGGRPVFSRVETLAYDAPKKGPKGK